jgi:hypothetical protein
MAMKILSRHLGLGALAAASMLLAAPAAMAAITGSAHDFSANGWSNGQICVACHAPHNNNNLAGSLLWNHALTAAGFTLYTSPTLNAVAGQPTGVSKLCLSCHDGTVAIDSFGGATGINFVGGAAKVGPDLSNDHPISITYDAALVTADGGLKAIASTANIGPGGAKTGTIDSNLLNGGKIECSSCHDVHNTNVANATPGTDMLKITSAGSALCLTCHNK